MKKYFSFLSACLLFFAAAAQSSRYISGSHDRDSFGIIEIRSSGYQFISPLLDCYEAHPPGLRQMKNIEDKLKAYIASAKSMNKASAISVYYRDLSNGPWLGIDEDAGYAPASLLKVPILIAGLKFGEYNKGFLNKTLTYQPSSDPTKPQIITGSVIKPGETYTILQLLEHMIIYSDNEAKNLVLDNIPTDILNQIVYDLGVDTYNPADPENFMSVKGYAAFFRILYNATFLNKEMSELALEILGKSVYNRGILAGVPQDIIVANKFGERSFENSNLRQLHDCGIIYKKNNPYLLCIMTRGYNNQALEEVISTISKIVYDTLNTGL